MRSGDHLMNDVTPSAATPATAVITVRLRAGAAAAFSAWQAKASLAAAAFPGFISAETIPERTGVAWSVVHCFRSTADVDAWRASARVHLLLAQEDDPTKLIPTTKLFWQDPDVRWLAGVNESDGNTWFNKEAFEELIVWLQLPALVKAPTKPTA